MDFEELLSQAKAGEESAVLSLFQMYKPALVRNAIIGGSFDEDLYQELCITFLKCIRLFVM